MLTTVLWIVAIGALLGLVARREVPSRLNAPTAVTVLTSVVGMAAGWLVALPLRGPDWLPYVLSPAGAVALVAALTLVVAARRRTSSRTPQPSIPTAAEADRPASVPVPG